MQRRIYMVMQLMWQSALWMRKNLSRLLLIFYGSSLYSQLQELLLFLRYKETPDLK
ncbi:hypothetical protein REPUB_Repub08aG0041000 [Reevesia pubescens]